MAVKYQVFLCKRPQDLLLITLNHVDEIRKFLLGDSYVMDLLDHTHSLLFSVSCITAAAVHTSVDGFLFAASFDWATVVCDVLVKLLTSDTAECSLSHTCERQF